MMNKIINKTWDSKYFGFNVGEYTVEPKESISLENLRSEAKDQKFALLYVRSSDKLPDFEGIFCDEKIEYATTNFTNNSMDTNCIHEYQGSEMDQQLINLAFVSGKYSRYHLDPSFPNEKFKGLYRIWMEKSVSHEIATGVLVYQYNKSIGGVLTYKIEHEHSSVGLFAVDPKIQGKGIGTKLLNYLFHIIPHTEQSILTIDTQGVNKPARHFYEKNGLFIKSTTWLYHVWV